MTSLSSFTALPSLLVLLVHPTTRSLLQSVLSQVAALDRFLATLSTPLPFPPLSTPIPFGDSAGDMAATNAARELMREAVSRSGMDLLRLEEALDLFEGQSTPF